MQTSPFKKIVLKFVHILYFIRQIHHSRHNLKKKNKKEKIQHQQTIILYNLLFCYFVIYSKFR